MHTTFGQFISRMRSRRNLTQSEVAKAIGVTSPDFISLIEHGYRNLGLDRVPRLAEVLRVDVKDLCLMALEEQYPIVADVLRSEEPAKAKRTSETDEMVRMVRALDSGARSTVKDLLQQLYDHGRRGRRLGPVAA